MIDLMLQISETPPRTLVSPWVNEALTTIKQNGYNYDRFIKEASSKTNVADGVNDIFADLMDVLMNISVATHRALLKQRDPKLREKCEKIIVGVQLLSEICYQLSIDGVPLRPARESAMARNQAGDNLEVFRAAGININGTYFRDIYIMVRPHRFVQRIPSKGGGVNFHQVERGEISKQPRFTLSISTDQHSPNVTLRVDLDKERVDRALVRRLSDLAGRGITFDIIFEDNGVNLMENLDDLGISISSRRHGYHFDCDKIEGMDVAGGFTFGDILLAIATKIKKGLKVR